MPYRTQPTVLCYYAIVKDMQGAFTDAGKSMVLFYSLDGLDWKLASHPLVSDLNINWANGNTQKLEAIERPQLFFENGEMVTLLCAVRENMGHSYNVQIPLKRETGTATFCGYSIASNPL